MKRSVPMLPLGPRLDTVELVEGLEVALHLKAGAWLGRVATVRRSTIVLFAWGRAAPVSFRLAEVDFARLVTAHSWVQGADIRARQRRGLPGIARQGRGT